MTIQIMDNFTDSLKQLNEATATATTTHQPQPRINKIEFKNYEFSSICKIDETQQLVVVDEKQNEILLFTDQFDYIKSLKTIAASDVQISHPERIYYANGSVYLVQRNMHQVFQLDIKLNKIKKLIRKSGEIYDSRNYPLDVYVNSDSIYILMLRPRLKTSIQVFDLNGEFKREVQLTTVNSNRAAIESVASDELKLKINNEIVIVYNATKVYIFDIEGLLKHTLHVSNISQCCFIHNYLVVHSDDGRMGFYAAGKQTPFEKYFFKLIAQTNKINELVSKSSFIQFLNDSLMLFLSNENSITIVNFYD